VFKFEAGTLYPPGAAIIESNYNNIVAVNKSNKITELTQGNLPQTS